MADILDAAQSNTQSPPSATPVEPPPAPPEPPVIPEPPATTSDSLIIPPPEAPTPPPPEEPKQEKIMPPEKPKKKSRMGVLLAGLLLLVITLPILVVFVRQQVEIRSRATTGVYFCSGPDDEKMSSSYTCVSVYHGTFNESNGQGCCTLGTAPTGTPSCTLATRPTCPGNGTPQCTGTTWSCPTVFCSGSNDEKTSSSYTCVSVYHGTFNESNGQGCCTLGHSPNGNPSCTLATRPTCPNNVTPNCTGTTWSCTTPINTPTPPICTQTPTCIFDNWSSPQCVGEQLCEVPIGEMGWSESDCTTGGAQTACCKNPYYCTSSHTCIKNGVCTPTGMSPRNCHADTSCVGNTPTPSPQCISIVAYKDGNALSPSDLAALQPGDTITLAFAPGGAATKVRFRVNAGSWNETTTKNANSQFTWNYTLESVASFTIEAQWFDGSVWH